MSRRVVNKLMAVVIVSIASMLVYVPAGDATTRDTEAALASTASRSPEEIWQHHLQSLDSGDLDEIVADYADDAVLITSNYIWRGKDGIRAAYAQSGEQFANVVFDRPTQIFAGDVLFVEFTGSSAQTAVLGGAETFVFGDGLIQKQTLRYNLQHREDVVDGSRHDGQ
jgi:hypothetical protein